MRLFTRLGVLLVAAAAVTVPLRSQSSLPTRLVQQADLVHVGSFTLPDVQDTAGNYAFEYAQGVLAFNQANGTLFVVGHDWTQQVAEINIPSMGGVATIRQAFRDPLEGKITLINPTDPNSKKIGGLYVDGNKLIVSAYSYYDGAGTATASHFVRSTTLSTASVQGPIRVGSSGPAFYAGYFTPVPSVWQSALGGPVLNGSCCLGVVSRTSYGPAVSSIDPATILNLQNPSPAKDLVQYPDLHQTLAAWDSTGPLFNGTTIMRGVLLPEGTATVLFFGRHGMGKFCYGEPTACNDPEDTGKGTHAYPYEPHVWAYNANDLAAVKSGAKQPWDVKPYATFRLPGLTKAGIGGVTVDPATGRVFVSEQFGDGVKLRIHVFTISGSTTGSSTPPADSTAPSVSVTSPTAGQKVSGTATFSATASDNVGVTSVWFTVDGTTVGSEDTAAPYSVSVSLSGLSSGSHAVRAVARDAAGNTGTSNPVTITVGGTTTGDTTAPVTSVTAPTNGSTVKGTATLTATATDNVGVASVQFTVDGANVGSADTASPYSYAWSTTGATNGSHAIRAIARDAAGNVTTSSAVTVTVSNTSTSDTTAPSVSLMSPSAGSTISGNVSLTASASDNVKVTQVTFMSDGVAVGTATVGSGSTFRYVWVTDMNDNGAHKITAVARDAAGNSRTSSSATVTVKNSRSRGR